jgi:hypothetical protein
MVWLNERNAVSLTDIIKHRDNQLTQRKSGLYHERVISFTAWTDLEAKRKKIKYFTLMGHLLPYLRIPRKTQPGFKHRPNRNAAGLSSLFSSVVSLTRIRHRKMDMLHVLILIYSGPLGTCNRWLLDREGGEVSPQTCWTWSQRG